MVIMDSDIGRLISLWQQLQDRLERSKSSPFLFDWLSEEDEKKLEKRVDQLWEVIANSERKTS